LEKDKNRKKARKKNFDVEDSSRKKKIFDMSGA